MERALRIAPHRSRLGLLLPGILLAATGVGAGDLMTTSLAGSEVGLTLLWAIAAGAALKFVLSEGVARWQLATGTTLLEGWATRLGGWIKWVFLAYLLFYTLAAGAALITACGVAGAGLIPLGSAEWSKTFWGLAHAAAGLGLVWAGSFRLFERLMTLLTGVMFVTVVATAVLIGPDWGAVARGFVPSIPASGSKWLLAVIGGVGSTVTLLSYGYWIREEGRQGLADVAVCRVDLAVGNGITALFGMAALIIGTRVTLPGDGSALALMMADQLAGVVGPWGRWVFLAGFWGAVFSSLLGVWQSVPYMFADFWRQSFGGGERAAYRGYLLFISTVPALLLWFPVRAIQLAYGLITACFLPLLAVTLLILNNRREWVGREFLTGWAWNLVLVAALVFFAYTGGGEVLVLIR